VPDESAEEVIVTVPPEQVPEPTDVTLSYKVTVSVPEHVSVKAGVVLDVMLSVFDEPVSVPAVMSGVPGAASAVESMVTESDGEAVEVFPAGSVNFVVMTKVPSGVRAEVVMLNAEAEHTAVPTSEAPAYILTVSPVVQEPVKVGVVLLVTLSVDDEPVSEPAVMSGVPGAVLAWTVIVGEVAIFVNVPMSDMRDWVINVFTPAEDGAVAPLVPPPEPYVIVIVCPAVNDSVLTVI